MFTTVCEIYACRNMAEPDPRKYGPRPLDQVTAVVDGETVNLEVCTDHRVFFEATPAENYSIGRTFTGEIEVRPQFSKPVIQDLGPE